MYSLPLPHRNVNDYQFWKFLKIVTYMPSFPEFLHILKTFDYYFTTSILHFCLFEQKYRF